VFPVALSSLLPALSSATPPGDLEDEKKLKTEDGADRSAAGAAAAVATTFMGADRTDSADGTTYAALLATLRAADHTIEPPPITTELVPLKRPIPMPTPRPTADVTAVVPEETTSGVIVASDGIYDQVPLPSSGVAEISSRSSCVS
jgi:hypothetical protein